MRAKKKSPRIPVVRFTFGDGTHADIDAADALAKGRAQISKYMELADKELMRHAVGNAKEKLGAQKGIETIQDDLSSRRRQAINLYKHLSKRHSNWIGEEVYAHIRQKLKISSRTLESYLAWAREQNLIPQAHPVNRRTRRR